ncbi:uncharacterized protein [Hetaerina americana]|uniref:uncharacterized protein n=1 Tax=Hetaerina americana TaxID=62018 RepID=UPI003A7F26FE
MWSQVSSFGVMCAFLVSLTSAEVSTTVTSAPYPSPAPPSRVPTSSFVQHRAYNFFSRATAPFEGPLRSCFLEDAGGSLVGCLKEKAAVALERASQMDTVSIGESVALVKRTNVEGVAMEDWRSNQVEPEVEEGESGDVDVRLVKGLARFLHGRALRLSLPDNLVPIVTRSLEEGRLKKHKHLGTMITCIAVVLKTLALASIAFIAKKALLLGKISLLLSAAVMMKKLMGGGGGGGSGTSYEVVSLHRRAHQLPHHGEVYGSGYDVAGDGGLERDGQAYGNGAYALLRRAKGIARRKSEAERVDTEPRGSLALPSNEWPIPQFQIEKGAD